MNSKLAALGAAFFLLGLGGCASMSEDECVVSDWHAVGYEDGSRGYSTQQFGTYRKACAKHGIAPDFQAYQQGRDRGLVEFCQPNRGFNYGASGAQYNGVCAADLEPGFLDAYNAGRQLYTLRSYVNSANSQIYSRESELGNVKQQIRDKEALLIAKDTTPEDRVMLLVDIKDLSERIGELEAQIEQLVQDRARYEADLSHYEQTVAYYGY